MVALVLLIVVGVLLLLVSAVYQCQLGQLRIKASPSNGYPTLEQARQHGTPLTPRRAEAYAEDGGRRGRILEILGQLVVTVAGALIALVLSDLIPRIAQQAGEIALAEIASVMLLGALVCAGLLLTMQGRSWQQRRAYYLAVATDLSRSPGDRQPR